MYVPQLTFTRFIAAVLIVFFHSAQDLAPFTDPVIRKILGSSNIAVSYFFLLSGFVMVVSNANKEVVDTMEFYKKRMLRIYPIYIIALVITLLYLLVGVSGIDLSGLIANVFLIQAWIPEKALSINYPAWSISVEIFFYLLFPLIFNYIFKKYTFKQLAIFVFMLLISTQIGAQILRHSDLYVSMKTNLMNFVLFFPLFHLATFLIGNVIGQYFLKNQRKGNYLIIIISIVLMIVLTLIFRRGIILQVGIMSIFFGPLVYFISKDNSFITVFFSKRIFVFLGEISYAIYILQSPVNLWVTKILKLAHVTNPQLVFYIFLFVLILISTFIYIVVEKIIYKKDVLKSFSFSNVNE